LSKAISGSIRPIFTTDMTVFFRSLKRRWHGNQLQGHSGRNLPTHFYSSPSHSKTAWNIVILILKGSSSMIWLHC